MSDVKHTPLLWAYGPAGRNIQEYGQSFAIYEQGAANLIAGVFGDVRGGKEVAEANAKMIVNAVNNQHLLARVIKRDILTMLDHGPMGLLLPDKSETVAQYAMRTLREAGIDFNETEPKSKKS